MARLVKLPELGENVDKAEILSVLVSPGDRVELDQPIIEVETDKAAVEVPAPAGGVVRAVHVKVGETIRVGQVILEIDGEGAAETPAPDDRPGETSAAATVSTAAEVARPTATASPPPTPSLVPAAAAPSVRRLARELGIDVGQVTGSGPGGRIRPEDVMHHARALIRQGVEARPVSAASPAAGMDLPDFSRFGEVQREPMSGVRRKTAETMTRSWLTIPHVTQFDRADITDFDRSRKHLASLAEATRVRLTLTTYLVRVLAAAVRVFPKFNASIDVAREEIVFKKYVNVGVAVDTDHGLLVPVIRNADRKSLLEIGRELEELAQRARRRASRPEDLRGAGLTLSNLGGLGTTYFSPLVNWPEVAVVGAGRASREPVYVDGLLSPRLILPLSVSYDHRLIDGADAARFLRWVAEALENPLALALDGGREADA